jgi:DNA polymerase-3 subunit gamma/tau
MSRVLKFDLKKIDTDLIAQYLSSICNQENITAGAEALALIAKAGDGSIRDSLSILDQAINISENNELSSSDIRDMLNVSDDNDIIDLLELIFAADIKLAIEKYKDILKSNASSVKIINALIDYVYTLTCFKTNVAPLEAIVSEDLLPRLKKISEKVSLASLSKIWQMLLKGIKELRFCERSDIVLEMLLVRIVYASKLPDLQELINVVYTDRTLAKNKEKINIEGERAVSLVNEALNMFPDAKIER